MNTVPINRNVLNGLFDNQKKLDELFDSIFDDNDFINNSPSSSQSGSRSTDFEIESQFSYDDGKVNESLIAIKQNPFYYVLTIVLEIAAIYFVAINLLP
jgi:hypothetical protein